MQFLLILSFMVMSSFAECNPPITLEDLSSVVEKTRNSYYPDLVGVKIPIQIFESSAYFLQINPRVNSVIKKRLKRDYILEVNSRLLSCPPKRATLKAILVHELKHVSDFVQLSGIELIEHATKYVASMSYRINYERWTDCHVLELGLGNELSDYRRWLYGRLDSKDLEIKKRIYLTPEEIHGLQIKGSCSFR